MSQTPSHMRKVPVHILDDLSSKFLINLPEAEKSDLIRLFFQIELAHWFFLDFYCTQEENAIFSCGIKQFALNVFDHIPFLNHHVPNLNTILDEWRSYKMSVPTYGAILLTPDMNHCLLVQSFFAKNSWSFPKGKVNENEDPDKCAVREVYEETGFDCGHLIDPNAFVEGQTSNFQYTRLYIVKNVPIDTKFCPRTRNEIKDCSWFTIDLLPTNRNDDGYLRNDKKIRANSFYMILPFISKLKHWIMNERLGNVMRHGKKKQNDHQQKNNTAKKNAVFPKLRNGKQRNKSTGDPIETFCSPPVHNSFYNDHLKQNNTSTPISNHSPFMTSTQSAFRAPNSENKLNSFKKKPKQNGKPVQPVAVPNGHHQDQIKRRLFNETNENARPVIHIKPYLMDVPDCWKNFTFDRQKIFACL